MKNNLSILLVEDNARECGEIINYIERLDDTSLIGVTNNTTKALEIIADSLPDALILDLELHNGLGNGLTLLQDLKKLSLPFIPYILITTNNSSSITHKSARKLGADFIIPKYKEDYSAKTVVDFLRMMKAYSSVLYFEDIRIYRDHVNMTNRLNNCEQANVEKTINTANQQLNYIKILEDNAALDLLDEKDKEIIQYRKKYYESSLQELSEIITLETNYKMTKSGLNHRFRKIKDLALKLSKDD